MLLGGLAGARDRQRRQHQPFVVEELVSAQREVENAGNTAVTSKPCQHLS
jgi:hypothetical protein